MRMQLGKATLAAVAAAAIVIGTSMPMSGQTPSAARTADGKPNLTGIWQVMNTANWDIQTHPARQGPVVALGAAFSIPPGVGVVEGNEVPYQPWAAAKKKENGDNWMTRDPEVKCFMPGIPRATYMPFPFQIVQSANTILMAYEFTSASRIVRMNSKERSPAPSWMGWAVGRWEGDTLVIDVTDQMEDTWFDRAGNFHSDALHVVERYTPGQPQHAELRGDHRGSEGLHPAVEDEHAALPKAREGRTADGIQVRRVRGRAHVRASPQEAVDGLKRL